MPDFVCHSLWSLDQCESLWCSVHWFQFFPSNIKSPYDLFFLTLPSHLLVKAVKISSPSTFFYTELEFCTSIFFFKNDGLVLILTPRALLISSHSSFYFQESWRRCLQVNFSCPFGIIRFFIFCFNNDGLVLSLTPRALLVSSHSFYSINTRNLETPSLQSMLEKHNSERSIVMKKVTISIRNTSKIFTENPNLMYNMIYSTHVIMNMRNHSPANKK